MLRLGQFPRTFILHLSLTTLVAMLTWLSAQEAWALTAKQCAVLYSSWDADRNNDTTAGCSHNAQPARATELDLAAATETDHTTVAEPARAATETWTATLWGNRNRLITDWARRMGYASACDRWGRLSCQQKGAFLTLTRRLQIYKLASSSDSPLDHVTAVYGIFADYSDGNSTAAIFDDSISINGIEVKPMQPGSGVSGQSRSMGSTLR